MAKIDLSIVDRGTSGTGWTKEDIALTAEHLDEVMEQKTDNSGALNSLPTPFARFFVAREAFRRAQEEHIDSKQEAGFAYRQIVSDILDVYELLFYLNFHKNNTWKNGEKLEIREWDSEEQLPYIKSKMPILYNSIASYYQSDIKEKKLYFVIYIADGKEKLLACSSPITGFVTPPDLDKSIVKKNGTESIQFAGQQYEGLHIMRKSGGEYFHDIKMFEDRDADFKNYMFNELFGPDGIDDRFKRLKEYIRSFHNDPDIRIDYKQELAAISTDQNSSLIINGLCIKSFNETDILSFFTDSMIKVPFRISRENYVSVKYQNDSKDRDYDYLLPFKPEVMALFEGLDIDSDLRINRNSVTVSLRHNGKEYKKEYSSDPFRPGIGKIVDLKQAKISFNLGIFPNILSYKEQENNYFKILVVGADEDPEAPNFTIDKISLTFFRKEEGNVMPIRERRQEEEATFGVKPAVVRSRQKTDAEESGTKLYELFNTSFDLLEIKVLGDTGILLPIWQKGNISQETFTYAIDLGTSSTFIASCKNDSKGQADLSQKPELFKMERAMVNYMHEASTDRQIPLARRFEESIFSKAVKKIKTEFVPPLIDGTSYKFPIRTALCGIHNSPKTELFDTHNIAFFYEKFMPNDDQEIMTDIKWNKDEDMLRVFVRELLLIIKCDILQRNGDLDRTHLVWFNPLSFMGQTKSLYERVWSEESRNILFIKDDQINRFSESEAPYYYYKKMDYIKDSDAATVIDIGGGSTDFVYFKDNQPQAANSVHFGCDVLWENGFKAFGNVRDNGIYCRYSETIHFSRNDLEELYENFKNTDTAKTKDIINFWLTNAKYCNITRLLNEDFKPVFVYHLTAILFYMSYMYKDYGLPAPKSIIFSGNGSKYIDNFISSDRTLLRDIIDMVFERVFGGTHNVYIELPDERKESTCYGGLYREKDAPNVKEVVYQGQKEEDLEKYETVGNINSRFDSLREELLNKYGELASLYEDILNMLKKQGIIESNTIAKYTASAKEDMGTDLSTYYKTQVREKYTENDSYKDSVFFLPIINKIFEMTNI